MSQTERADAIQAFYDADAQGYYQHRWNRNAVTRADYATTRASLLELLRPAPDTRLLEIGCGPGTWTEVIVAQGASVTALDISQRMLAEAQRRVPLGDVTFIQADFATWTPEEGTRFDGAYSVRVFEHLQDKSGALRQLYGLLRPGARAVIITKTAPSIWNGRVRIMRALRRILGRQAFTSGGGERGSFWMERAMPWKLARLMETAGFVGVGVTPVIFRPPLFRGGESEYPIIGPGLASPLLRWHHRLVMRTMRWPAMVRMAATLGSESYAAWGVVPGGSLP